MQTLLEAAPTLLPPHYAPPEAIRAATLHVVRTAAKKGFVRLSSPEATS